MVLIYIVFNFFSILLSNCIYRKWINPISMYAAVWVIAVGVHESGLIYYYDIEPFTWFVIFLMQIVFNVFSYIGFNLKTHQKTVDVTRSIDLETLEVKIKKYLLITSLIASIAIMGDVIATVKNYGSNLINNLTIIYSDRVHKNVDITTIPYLGSFVYIATSLAGICLRKFGFSFYILLPLLLGMMRSLTTGGRAGIVFVVIIFLYSYMSFQSEKERRSMSFKQKIWLVFCCFALLYAILIISRRRSVGELLPYATNKYTDIFGNNATIYKVLTYIASPIGALNQYLKTCEFNFGENSFLAIYNLIAKIGIIDRINQYQEFFNTPEPCNVATWLRELIEDFTLGGAVLVVSLFATVTSFIYKKTNMPRSIRNVVVWSILAMIITLSFFDWRFRSPELWIALFFGYIIGRKIDQFP